MKKIIINNLKFDPRLIDSVQFSIGNFHDMTEFCGSTEGSFIIKNPSLLILLNDVAITKAPTSPEEAMITVLNQSKSKNIPKSINIYGIDVINTICTLQMLGYYTKEEGEKILIDLDNQLNKIQFLYNDFISKGYVVEDFYNFNLLFNTYEVRLSNKTTDIKKFNAYQDLMNDNKSKEKSFDFKNILLKVA